MKRWKLIKNPKVKKLLLKICGFANLDRIQTEETVLLFVIHWMILKYD
jgi:hypothetical protein